mgnify:FL=1|tara:strand:+ start:270 stop:920 length:651 start_codon:yes stop_codon:yes gene_type:complete
MKQLKIKVPSSLSDIKLSQYKEFLKESEGEEDEAKLAFKMVCIFCELPEVIVENISKQSYDGIVSDLNKVFVFDKDKLPLINKVRYNGLEYGFIPNMDDITVKEQADADGYLKDWQKADMLMGVLYRPIASKRKDRYLIEDYKAGVSLDFTMDIVFGAYFFLQNLYLDLLSCIPNFIKEEVQQDQKLQSLVENGVGIKTFTNCLEEAFLGLKMLKI